jgi:hypothetical protein
MDTVGIVLAGGLATRLPNKALLPLHSGRPVISSGIDYLMRSELKVIVVVPPGSVLVDILSTMYPKMLSFVQQDEPKGVPDALGTGAKLAEAAGYHRVVAACCDNVFPEAESYPDKAINNGSWQQVRDCPPWQAMHLSRYTGEWQERATHGSSVAGWLSMPAGAATSGLGRLSMIEFLTDLEVQPHDETVPGWYDLGVADAYARYWRQK